jgi:hypothetical protein
MRRDLSRSDAEIGRNEFFDLEPILRRYRTPRVLR